MNRFIHFTASLLRTACTNTYSPLPYRPSHRLSSIIHFPITVLVHCNGTKQTICLRTKARLDFHVYIQVHRTGTGSSSQVATTLSLRYNQWHITFQNINNTHYFCIKLRSVTRTDAVARQDIHTEEMEVYIENGISDLLASEDRN